MSVSEQAFASSSGRDAQVDEVVGIIGRVIGKEALPFLAVTLGILLLITFVPDIALFLPHLMGY